MYEDKWLESEKILIPLTPFQWHTIRDAHEIDGFISTGILGELELLLDTLMDKRPMFCKLHSRSPRDLIGYFETVDEYKIKRNLLRVYNGCQVLDLLTRSDRVYEDLMDSEPEEQQYIVLKPWREIAPGSEWRGFIRENKVVGLAPFWDFTQPWVDKTFAQKIIQKYIDTKNHWVPGYNPSKYVIDLEITPEHTRLIEYNPFDYTTGLMGLGDDILDEEDREKLRQEEKLFSMTLV